MLEARHKINETIARIYSQVVLIDADGTNYGAVPVSRGLQIAQDAELDLVLVSSNPPTCKIFDYQKFLYALKKKKKVAKPITISCIRFGLVTDVHDFQVKIRKVTSLLQEGHKVTIMVRCRGRREALHIEDGGVLMMQRVLDVLGETVRIEQSPKISGRSIRALVASASK